ncbi:hypothetical protein BJ944DRAFT_23601 [Cunninghamella echinulata]|nr:hypothetical protein BJ944DRAFT_23601 [Cunninghamella echinulata]
MSSPAADKTDKNKEKPKDWLPPAKRHNMTEIEKRQRQLDKMFENIEKPIVIPSSKTTKKEYKPKDFVRNVSVIMLITYIGSSAGAGSGDFHVYRALRRREYSRLQSLEEEERKEREMKEYQEEINKKKEECDERTAKKRARRQKRKQNKEEVLKENTKKQKVEAAPLSSS